MTDAELNRAIAAALGHLTDEVVKDGWCSGDAEHFPHRTPNYANDLNATMAVIRERWPSAWVRFDKRTASFARTETTVFDEATKQEVYTSWPPYFYGEGPDDAHRVAHALLEALTGVSDV